VINEKSVPRRSHKTPDVRKNTKGSLRDKSIALTSRRRSLLGGVPDRSVGAGLREEAIVR
jgi:hypothetical protein